MKLCHIANLSNMWTLFGDFRPLEHLFKPVYKQALEWATEGKKTVQEKQTWHLDCGLLLLL